MLFMDLNNIRRELSLSASGQSTFLFGPRMTGKTSLLEAYGSALFIDLLNPDEELRYRLNPASFYEALSSLKAGSTVIVDEIQRLPVLLDYVQMGIQKLKLRFLLSGSSARKLRRGSVNLLGGRAIDLRLHPLTSVEMGSSFRLESSLQFGSMPKIHALTQGGSEAEARRLLRSYVTTYLNVEVKSEALVRDIDGFSRFLNVAAQANAQMVEFANIGRESAVHMNTVKGYYSILEDTLVGNFLWPYHPSERKKARPRFYFFDCGVVRAIQNRLGDPPTAFERGFLFETFFINEIRAARDYLEKEHELAMWREGRNEVDLLVLKAGRPVLAIEVKSSTGVDNLASLSAFHAKFPKVPLYVASATAKVKSKHAAGFEIWPFRELIKLYREF